jgi:exonuclease 3'-5' domain-containing protein 1
MTTYRVTTSDWNTVKEAGLNLFAPERGGSYQVFETRPLDARILAYCAQDVAQLPDLETSILHSIGYSSRGDKRGAQKKFVEEESAARVTDSHRVGYNPDSGRHKALANVSFYNRGF